MNLLLLKINDMCRGSQKYGKPANGKMNFHEIFPASKMKAKNYFLHLDRWQDPLLEKQCKDHFHQRNICTKKYIMIRKRSIYTSTTKVSPRLDRVLKRGRVCVKAFAITVGTGVATLIVVVAA